MSDALGGRNGPHTQAGDLLRQERFRLDLGALCEGARILTEEGSRPIEQLQPGDRILTQDNGPLPLHRVWAIPTEEAPATVVRMRRCYIKGSHDLYGLPSQAVHLQHGLEEALFAARALLVTLGCMVAGGKAEVVARHDRQLYRLDLGQTCCITANGHVCGLLSSQPSQPEEGGPVSALRLLSRSDAIFALKSRSLAQLRQRTA